MSEKIATMPFEHYQAICNTVRAKTATLDPIKSGEMAAKIASIEVGGGGGGSDELAIGLIERSATELVIPEGVTTIAKYAFHYHSALEKITMPDSVKTIGQYAFSNCSKLADVEIGNGVETIDLYSFQYCTALQSIVIPSCVKKLGQFAFNGTNLKTVVFKGTSITIGNTYTQDAFTSSVTDIYVPWAEGAVKGAPWGATNATIHYNSEV